MYLKYNAFLRILQCFFTSPEKFLQVVQFDRRCFVQFHQIPFGNVISCAKNWQRRQPRLLLRGGRRQPPPVIARLAEQAVAIRRFRRTGLYRFGSSCTRLPRPLRGLAMTIGVAFMSLRGGRSPTWQSNGTDERVCTDLVVPARGGDMSPPYRGFTMDGCRVEACLHRPRSGRQCRRTGLYRFGSSCTGGDMSPPYRGWDRPLRIPKQSGAFAPLCHTL